MDRAVRIHGGDALVGGSEGHSARGALVQRVGELGAVLRADLQGGIGEGDGFRRGHHGDYAGLGLAVVGPDGDADLAGLQRGDQAGFVHDQLRLVSGGKAVATGGAGGQGRGELRGLAHAEDGAGGLEAHAGGSLLDGDLEGGLLAVVGLDGDGGASGALAGDHAVCIHGHVAGVGRGECQRADRVGGLQLRSELQLLVQADGGALRSQRHGAGRGAHAERAVRRHAVVAGRGDGGAARLQGVNRAVRIHGGDGLVRGREGHSARGALVQRVGKLYAVLRADLQGGGGEGDGFRRGHHGDYAGLRLAVVGPDADADLAGLQRGDQAGFVHDQLRLVGGGEAVAAGGAGG